MAKIGVYQARTMEILRLIQAGEWQSVPLTEESVMEVNETIRKAGRVTGCRQQERKKD
jgi:hypothetical protein